MTTQTAPSRSEIVTKAQLVARSDNYSFNRQYQILDLDVDKVNRIIKLIEDHTFSGKTGMAIRPGDGIELHGNNRDGHVVYEGGRVSAQFGELLYCTNPHVPHIRENLSMESGGGYFGTIEKANLEYMGIGKREFWMWGHAGPCKDGGIYFEANVRLWRYVDLEKIY